MLYAHGAVLPLRRLVELADACVAAMSNLLSANIESGLQHIVVMGYTKDQETRAAFLQILTNIMLQV